MVQDSHVRVFVRHKVFFVNLSLGCTCFNEIPKQMEQFYVFELTKQCDGWVPVDVYARKVAEHLCEHGAVQSWFCGSELVCHL